MGGALLVDAATGERQVLAQGALISLLDVTRGRRRALLRPRPPWRPALRWTARRGTRPPAPRHRAGRGSDDRRCRPTDERATPAATTAANSPRWYGSTADGSAADPAAGRADAELEDVVLRATAPAPLLWNIDGGRSALSLLDFARRRAACRRCPGRWSATPASGRGGVLLLTAEGRADPRGVWSVDADRRRGAPLRPGRAELRAFTRRVGRAGRGRRPDPPAAPAAAREGRAELPVGSTGPGGRGAVADPGVPARRARSRRSAPVYNSLFQSLRRRRGRRLRRPTSAARRVRALLRARATTARSAPPPSPTSPTAWPTCSATGVAQPGRVGCMGRSYGGWLTLAALVEHPELFAVGVDVCGMADFATFYARHRTLDRRRGGRQVRRPRAGRRAAPRPSRRSTGSTG